MRIGIVCPYSFDVPGGVQWHVRDLAEHFLADGHHASVLAPADEDTPLPDYVESVGRAVSVPYNGSVARLNFGPVTAARVGRWLERGDFDVVHIHEPVTPSIALLALWSVEGPVVATFHTSNLRSRAMQAAYPLLRPSLEKINGRIAVSEDARRTVTTHLGGDAVIIPNGVYTDFFSSADPRDMWRGTTGAPSLGYLGRLDEPRKGFDIALAGMRLILERYPSARLFVAGHGDWPARQAGLEPALARAVQYLGPIDDAAKAEFMRSMDVYLAPQTGGESFGIVLVEAMASGTPVVASDLPAFVRVLDGGSAGALFRNGDPQDLASTALRLLDDRVLHGALVAAGRQRAAQFDWSVVAEDVMAVYEMVSHEGSQSVEPSGDTRWTRLLRGRKGDRAWTD